MTSVASSARSESDAGLLSCGKRTDPLSTSSCSIFRGAAPASYRTLFWYGLFNHTFIACGESLVISEDFVSSLLHHGIEGFRKFVSVATIPPGSVCNASRVTSFLSSRLALARLHGHPCR